MCQSLVLGAYTNLKNPENTYVLTTAGKGWDLLKLLASKSSEQLLSDFECVLKERGVQVPARPDNPAL
jgi:hypothetical protein